MQKMKEAVSEFLAKKRVAATGIMKRLDCLDISVSCKVDKLRI